MIKEVPEEDYLWLSGIQNFAFCRRQWALMRIEGVWQDNQLTAEGTVQHEKAHDPFVKESRGDVYIVRAMRVVSRELAISGECDVVEFYRDDISGVNIFGKPGKWIPCPIEYKHGRSKIGDEDRMQLCAEAMCLEEMLCCSISFGYLFYQSTRRREKVILTDELRSKVRASVEEMWDYQKRGFTPKVRKTKKCSNCSINDLCVSKLYTAPKVEAYIKKQLEEE